MNEPKNLRQVYPRVCAFCIYSREGDGDDTGTTVCARDTEPGKTVSFDNGEMGAYMHVCDYFKSAIQKGK